MVGCKPTPIPAPKPVVEYHFGAMSAETTEDSATITVDIPAITIDGVEDKSATFSLGYYEAGLLVSDRTVVEEYTTEGNKAIFSIEALKPDTEYIALLSIQSANAEGKESEPFGFRTKQHTPKCEIAYTAEVDAKGIMATITLGDVSYLVDGEAQEIESVKLEYARKRSELEWVEVDMTDRESVTLPEEGGKYLDEKSNYLYKVTITPANREFEPITTDEQVFETKYAEVTAKISKPDVAIVGDNIEIVVESIEVRFDGIERPDYHYLEHFVYYRETGGEEAYWENKSAVKLTNGGISLSLALSSFDEGKEYEFAGAVEAGAEHKVRLSEIVTITIPKREEPTPPTPPTPPVGGDADTTALAGTWHLSEWRGTAPSFDVYLSISEDGVVSLYQRLESREWELFYSTVTYADNTLWGTYTDGTAWSASYSVTLDGDKMTWVDTADPTDISVYTRTELPDSLPTATTEATRTTTAERFL